MFHLQNNEENRSFIYLNIGRHLVRQKLFGKAERYLNKTIREDNKLADAYSLRALCRLRMSRIDEAIEDAETSLKMNKNQIKLLLLLGEIRFQRGDFEQSLLHFANGHRRYSHIKAFETGMAKCILAIKNTLNHKLQFKKNSDVNLTDFYLNAFPIKDTKEHKMMYRNKHSTRQSNALKWLNTCTTSQQSRLLRSSYLDLIFLRNTYSEESNRMQEVINMKGPINSMHTQVLATSKFTKMLAMECNKYLDYKAELNFKLNPIHKT